MSVSVPPIASTESDAPAGRRAEPATGGIAAAATWLAHGLGSRDLPPLVVAIGFGEGQLFDVLEQVAPATRVLVFEPDPLVAERCLGRRDWDRPRESGQLVYLSGPDYAGADAAWRSFPPDPDNHLLLVDPELTRRGGEAATHAARAFKKVLFGARANASARRRFAPRYLENALANLPAMLDGRDVRALSDAYRGVPAVIAGAGPSLDRALPQLAAHSFRALLIATDTALRPMLAAGLRPPLVVGVDPGDKNARHFHGLTGLEHTWLVAESALDPSAVKPFGDRTFWFRLSDHQPWPWYASLGFDTGYLQIWGSVLTAAFQTAVLAGCDPIIFVGADLSFTGGRPYARGTTYEFDWAYSAAIGDTIDRAWQTQMAMCDRITVADVHGTPASTTEPLQAFRDWMVVHAAKSGRRVVNATGAGILAGPGIEQASLEEVLHSGVALSSPDLLPRRSLGSIERANLSAHFRRARQAVLVGERSSPAGDWHTFTGGSLDVDRTVRALDDAAGRLEWRARTDQPAELGNHPVAGPSTVARLPEDVLRLRRWLNGQDPGPRSADGTSALAMALTSLRAVVDGLLAFRDDPVAPLACEGRGIVPVSGARAWPPRLAWPLLELEAAIGAAIPASDGRREVATNESFFSRPVLPRASATNSTSAIAMSDERSAGASLASDLVARWIACAEHQTPRTRATTDRTAAIVDAIRFALLNGADVDATDHPAAVVLEARTDERGSRVELPVGPEPMLARALTGLLEIEHPPSHAASGIDVASRFSVGIRVGRVAARLFDSAPDGDGDALWLTPRVLTDEGVPRSLPVYGSAHGAVCASLHGYESFVVTGDGRLLPHVRWPRPICGVLPLGLDGAVGWNNGTHEWPRVSNGYVMTRRSPADPIEVHDLPVGPTSGMWWEGRLYWTLFPAGLASWTPEDGLRVLDRDCTLLSLRADDSAIALTPCVRGADGNILRSSSPIEWRWSPAGGLVTVPAGVAGSSWCRSADTVWAAEVFPEHDRIELRAADGRRVTLTCYYPFQAAWAGGSLVVGTLHGELLMFAALAAILDELTLG